MALPALGILAWLGSWFASFLASGAARFFAMKAILFFLVNVVVPIMVLNLIYRGMSEMFSLLQEKASDEGLQAFVWTVGGLAGWLIMTLRIPEAFTTVFGALLFRLSIKFFGFRLV